MRNIILFALLLGFLSCKGTAQEEDTAQAEKFPIEKSKAEWKKELSNLEYRILREEATEPAFSSPLLEVKGSGTFVCAGCQNPVFENQHKFESGTGWPSFDRAIEGNVNYSKDNKLGYTRVEEHCARCGGHLGHVFNDGPEETTGKRHCVNGAALNFKAGQ